MAKQKRLVEPQPPIIRESFNLFTQLITAYKRQLGRSELGNKSLLADLLGDAPVAVPPSTLVDPDIGHMLHKFLDLMKVPHNLTTLETMVRRNPWRGTISNARHFENCYYLISHEAYIFKERLKVFCNSVRDVADTTAEKEKVKAVLAQTLKQHSRAFKMLVAARGQHVHEQSNIPRDIARIGLLELLMTTPQEEFWRKLHKQATTAARSQWVENASNSCQVAERIIGHALSETQAIWSTAVQAELDKLNAELPDV